jgi:MFS family permease
MLMRKVADARSVFYGWWMVAGCLLIAAVGWSLTTFGMGVYIHAISEQQGFSIGLISTAVTVSYLIGAVCLVVTGTAIERFGPQPVIALGSLVMSAGVAALPFCRQGWQVFLAFAVLGVGRSAISPTSISTTLAPWFERHQGRAVSTALLGASVGGMISTPLLLAGIAAFGINVALVLAGTISVLIVLPIVLFVFKRSPQEMSLLPDGVDVSSERVPKPTTAWTRKGAMTTRRFHSMTIAFSLSMMVQIGFLSHHVSLVAPTAGDKGASIAVSAAALAAFVGRIGLARFADRVDLRLTTAGVMVIAAASLAMMSVSTGWIALLITSICYGLTIGNLATLSPIVTRREFGAASFGAIYGAAAAVIAFAMAAGPGLFGVLRDTLGSYGPALMIAAILNLAAAAIIVWGGRKALPTPF